MYFSEKIEIPDDQIIVQTKFSFVFVNIRPFLPFHLLISPKRIVERVVNLSVEEANDLFDTVRKTMKGMSFHASDFTVTIQDGSSAGQTVPHVHIHIIPRLSGDLAENNDIYKEGAFESDIDSKGIFRKDRSSHKMKEEADFLRSKFQTLFN